jgi:tetratricopeptide (TPR) repeat protein
MGNWNEARNKYELAVSINSSDYNTMYNLGELYLNSFGDPESAYKWFLRAVTIKPNHAQALKKLGVIAMNNRNYKEALTFFEKAEKNVTENDIVQINIFQATAYESLGMTDKAKTYYTKVLRKDPVNRIARHKVALL